MKAPALRATTVAILMALAATGQISAWAKVRDTGAWLKAPDLLEEHVGHTATLLQDGRVLVAGGTNVQGVATASCELFDPRTNRWVRAASMSSARTAHTATLLSDGSVLVTGGQTALSPDLASAEIYHPASNSWTPAAAMHVPRSRHNAVRLRDGRVLAVGGTILSPSGAPPSPQVEQAEVYDPARNNWSLAATILPALHGQAATLMPNGTVLVTGGSTDRGFATTSAEVFEPATNHWETTTWPMATPRYGHTATLLPNGRVLLVGGYSTQSEISGGFVYPNSELLTTSEIFDLRGNIGVRVGYSKIPRLEHTATLLRTGTVLVVGSAYASNADSQLFDPANTEDWVSTGMQMDRYLHTATLLADGRVLIAGGYGLGSPKSAWIFSPVSGVSASLSRVSPIPQIAAVLLLFVLVAIGFAATSGRLHRRGLPAIREPDSEWIDPAEP